MKDFKGYFIIPTEPEILYKGLTTAITIQLWSGAPAEMKEEVNTEFSLWDGSIIGKNLAFETNKMIQQEWYFGETEQPSVVTLKLHEHKQGTSLEVRHTNIPDEDYDDITEGWKEEYIQSLVLFYTE